jgi:Na+/melibiose symporter-like transporter
MASVVRRGRELREVVRQRRRMRWFLLVMMSINVALFAAMVWRRPDGLFIAALCVGSFALLMGLVTFVPRLELRALRGEITRPPLTRAQAQRWAYGCLLVAAVAVAASLIVGALFDAWLMAVGVAAPIALLFSLFAFFTVRAAERENPRR